MRILIIEDDAGITELLREQLAAEGHTPICVHSASEALTSVTSHLPDLMILDYALPDMTGSDFIDAFSAAAFPLPPFIVITGRGDERVASAMMKQGARDYVVKDVYFWELLPEIIRRTEQEITNEQRLQRAEEALRESEALYRELADSITDVFFAMDEHLCYTYWNKASERLTGIAAGDALGKSLFELFPNDPPTQRAVDIYQEVLRTQQPCRYINEYQLYGRRFFFEITVYPSQRGLSVFVKDITEQKRVEEEICALNQELEHRVKERTAELQRTNQALEESLDTLQKTQNQLIQNEKMASLGKLVAGMAHELNTPVGVSVTAASYLERATQDMETQYAANRLTRSRLEQYLTTASQSADIILHNLQRTAELIQSLKQVAVDQTSSHKTRFKLKAYINDLLISLRPTLNRTQHIVTVILPTGEDIELYSYPSAFSQILTNLIMNSLAHGFIQQDQGEIRIAITHNRTNLHIDYSDNGQGIAEDALPRIFEPFYTTTRGQGRTGLGLHIVYNLVTQQLDGSIHCESIPGQGTIFHITIPYAYEKVELENPRESEIL